MVTIETMGWDKARDVAGPIRFTVFVDEQRVPAEIELDEHDAVCVHAVAMSDGSPVGTGRLLPDGHIGRMAVLKAWRGKGVGAALLAHLTEIARARGDRHVALSAQTHALGFYRKHGFVEKGPIYDDAGIPHQAMHKKF